MDKNKFNITGMTCSACSAHIEKALRKLDGVDDVSVNLLTNSMEVQHSSEVSVSDIEKAVQKSGYGAAVINKSSKKTETPSKLSGGEENTKMRLIVSFAFLIPLMYVSMGHMVGLWLPVFLSGHQNAVAFAFTQFLLTIPIVFVNRKYYISGARAIISLSPNMDSLIAIGSSAALIYGVFAIYRIAYGLGIGDMQLVAKYHMDLYFESAATILALITLGKYLEAKSKGKTSEAINKLIDLTPKTACVERGGKEEIIDAANVIIGDIVVMRPGQSVPVDGVIIEGHSSLNEAAITGECIPVEKTAGAQVLSASINGQGFFKFKATRVGEDTTLAQVIHLVEQASASKAPIAKLADKISGVFVPVVIGVAILAAAIWLISGYSAEFALSVAIAVLVISCPCALGLATPVAIMVGTGKGAENGILIKSGEALQTAHKINTVVLDKTGTITMGIPRVTDVFTLNDFQKPELLRLAASLEAKSEHPLAKAIISENKMPLYNIADFKAESGKGISGFFEKERILTGNEVFMRENNVIIPAKATETVRLLSDDGKTPLIFAKECDIIGIIGVADEIKAESKFAIESLHKMGIETVMLTGDNERTALAVQKAVGIQRVVAGVLPSGKEREISRLKASGRCVAMIGDGINDAPALASADVGIAIGAGTDIAIESADIVLMKSDLNDAVTAIKLSRKVIINIKENLFWAFFYNAICIPLAAGLLFIPFGIKLSPMLAAAAMSLSSVCVVLNALRLKTFKPNKNKNLKGEIKMQKFTVTIEGMMCAHCANHTKEAILSIGGENIEVSLENKCAIFMAQNDISDSVITDAITAAGYTVVGIGR